MLIVFGEKDWAGKSCFWRSDEMVWLVVELELELRRRIGGYDSNAKYSIFDSVHVWFSEQALVPS